jgi:hypothetical protein
VLRNKRLLLIILLHLFILTTLGFVTVYFVIPKLQPKIKETQEANTSGESIWNLGKTSEQDKYDVDYVFDTLYSGFESNFINVIFELGDEKFVKYSYPVSKDTVVLCYPKYINSNPSEPAAYQFRGIYTTQEIDSFTKTAESISYENRIKLLRAYESEYPLRLGIKEMPDKSTVVSYIILFKENPDECK